LIIYNLKISNSESLEIYELVEQLICSPPPLPSKSPSDFLFGSLKEKLRGKKFNGNDGVKENVLNGLGHQD